MFHTRQRHSSQETSHHVHYARGNSVKTISVCRYRYYRGVLDAIMYTRPSLLANSVIPVAAYQNLKDLGVSDDPVDEHECFGRRPLQYRQLREAVWWYCVIN